MHAIASSHAADRDALFGLCYRMLGCAADAEDVVQETFQRALTSPPADREAPLRPWLMKVATNLCIDALRKRKREGYFGPWLPAPVETDRIAELEAGPEARYGAIESASIAFLAALELLDPKQRAVVVLRDVLGMSGAETAEALETSPENVRVIHHRARKALEAYDERSVPPTPEISAATMAILRRFMAALVLGNAEAVLEILADDVQTIHDANGEHTAAVRVVKGAAQVIELYRAINAEAPLPLWFDVRDMNGLPALVVRFPERRGRYAERLVFSIELDRAGRVRRVRATIASRKLHAVRFSLRG
jgi:RNA polymerase sigma-70 factor (ECF subfamily)